MSSFGQFAATSQFYLSGRSHYTSTGYTKHRTTYSEYKDDLFEDPSFVDDPSYLDGSVYMVTGANSGVGYEIARFLASKGGVLYMVCRNRERGEAAREKIVAETGRPDNVILLVFDVGTEHGVRECWRKFEVHSSEVRGLSHARLNCLVTNAGALLNERTATAEGVEVTFATHLLFGTYLLTTLALPTLESTEGARVVVVSSGGMLNTKFPKWEVAASLQGVYGASRILHASRFTHLTHLGHLAHRAHHAHHAHRAHLTHISIDGNLAYAFAKRGQVLLCERWARKQQEKAWVANLNKVTLTTVDGVSTSEEETEACPVKFVSCHPGWTRTAAVQAAYGESASYLEPMRTPWEGAEAIAWLCLANIDKLEVTFRAGIW